MAEQDGVKTSTVVIGGVALLVAIAAALVVPGLLEGPVGQVKPLDRPEAMEPAPPPPPDPDFTVRARTFFLKGGAQRCFERHLPQGQNLDGALVVTLTPDGQATEPELTATPQNQGVALCVQQRFSRGFTYDGPPRKVTFSFRARWEPDRLTVGQNVAVSP